MCAYVYLRATSDVEAAVYSASGTPMHPTPLSGAALSWVPWDPMHQAQVGSVVFLHREDKLSSCDLCAVVIFMACVQATLCTVSRPPDVRRLGWGYN